MSKVTKQELQRDINNLAIELTNLKIELSEKNVIDIEPKPQLKQLDQSVFKGSPDWAVSAAISPYGKAYVYSVTGDGFYGISDEYGYQIKGADRAKCIGGEYDASNWQNSLIERDADKGLTGSDLARAMLARGDEYVVCLVSNVADSHAIKNREHTTLIEQWVERDGFYNYRSQNWGHAVPANPATNEPLTASEVGL